MKAHTLSIVVAALVIAACSNTNEPDSAYIRGYVTVLDSGGIGVRDANGVTHIEYYPRILVEADPSDPVIRGTTKKSRVSWGPTTQFSSRSGKSLNAADLAVGQFVSVWITGTVLDSYPDQVGATKIVVESK